MTNVIQFEDYKITKEVKDIIEGYFSYTKSILSKALNENQYKEATLGALLGGIASIWLVTKIEDEHLNAIMKEQMDLVMQGKKPDFSK